MDDRRIEAGGRPGPGSGYFSAAEDLTLSAQELLAVPIYRVCQPQLELVIAMNRDI